MKLAIKAYAVTLILLMLAFAVPAQNLSEKDDRNTAPTIAGPTGLFTVYDGKTLRKGEYTFSAAVNNYDRDPGNADITTVPANFQIGLTNNLELFFNTEMYRGIKVNSPRNLSGFYLPNTGGSGLGAIVLAPGTTGAFAGQAVYRPNGMPFAAFPFTGSSAGNYQLAFSGPTFGFPALTNATLGPPRAGTGNASLFPGVGSVFGSILPGVVLQSAIVSGSDRPTSFSVAPSYLPDAPFIARSWAMSSFNSMDFGFKWRMNNSMKAVGYGIQAFYRWYPDTAQNGGGFNMLQRGAGPGSRRGDIGATFFVDARLASWVNLSGNVGYTFVSNPKFGSFVLLDRPDEFTWAVGLDFPANKYFQPMLEFSSKKYVRSRTPNAFEQDPMDGIAGVRIFPRRWFGMSLGYRINFNQQDIDSFSGAINSTAVLIPCLSSSSCNNQSIVTVSDGVPRGFTPSTDPHGYIAQFFIGRRDKRDGDVENKVANVNSVTLSDSVISLPCKPGFRSRSGACNDSKTISVQTSASDPENDPLVYNYTVSGGRIVGTGANVQWDLSGAQPGTYTITTGVDDGCGVCGKTDMRTVKVEECPDCVQVCECPTLSVSDGGVVAPGSAMNFTANLTGGASVTYNWTVSAGTISSGQGTSSISVDTTGLAGQNVTATVDIAGLDASCNCTTTASGSGSVSAKPEKTLVDTFGKAPDDDVKARVDAFYITLNNNPNAQGYIINYGTAAEIKKRRAQIMKGINFRKYDAGRVTFVDSPGAAGINTKFYLVPAGAEASNW
ncbi:MAG: hypothetical protein IPI64_14335 [Chloracidobacterium sp.]|nr:hypothetical protein [Chloracidobacterium sp.]